MNLQNKLFLQSIGIYTVTFSVLLQIYSMIINKNNKINSYAFILYGLGGFLLTYSVNVKPLVQDDKFLLSLRKFEILNSLALFFIGILALIYYK